MVILPRAVVGIDRPKEAEAFKGLWLKCVREKHGIVFGAVDRNAYRSPEEGDIVEAVLEDLLDSSIAQHTLNQ